MEDNKKQPPFPRPPLNNPGQSKPSNPFEKKPMPQTGAKPPVGPRPPVSPFAPKPPASESKTPVSPFAPKPPASESKTPVSPFAPKPPASESKPSLSSQTQTSSIPKPPYQRSPNQSSTFSTKTADPTLILSEQQINQKILADIDQIQKNISDVMKKQKDVHDTVIKATGYGEFSPWGRFKWFCTKILIPAFVVMNIGFSFIRNTANFVITISGKF